jgi:hypothetical protein
MNAIGRLFNVVQNASGVAIPLTRAGGVTFVTFEGDGSTIATFTELDSTGVESEQALDVDFEPHKGPGVGGTWTAMAEQDSTVDLGDDATNDSMVLSVNAEQLSTGYDQVECSVDGGVVTAIIHDLTVQRDPANLASSIVA